MKYFLMIWDKVSDKHQIVACTISLMLMISAAFLVPIPMTTGNVTLARWSYNIWAEHKKVNEEARIASIDRDVSQLQESRDGFGFVVMQLRLQALMTDRQHIESNKDYSTEERRYKTDRVNDRLDRLHQDMDRKGIRLDDLQSFNDGQIMIAYQK